MEPAVRTLIEGELALATPLHLGSGEATEREGLEVEEPGGKTRKAEVSAVVTDHEGRAYVPGRALKGALRSWLTTVVGLEGSPLVEQVLGSEQVLSREERGEKKVFGGKAEVWNAFVSELPSFADEPAGSPKLPPYWCAKRCTGVRASVALDRRTRTVASDRLFHEEFVPPGTKIRVRVSGQGLTEEELDLLLFALDGFNREPKRVSLGAGGADGAGRCSWALNRLSRQRPEEVGRWLAQQPAPAGYEGLFEVAEAERKAIQGRALTRWVVPPANELAVRLAITFDAPFLVAAPRRKTEAQEGTGEPDHVPVTDAAGRPLLPASSLRGALRHRAEKVLRTLGVHACRPEEPAEACKAVTKIEQVGDLCPACLLFGAPGWGTLLQVPDFEQVEIKAAHDEGSKEGVRKPAHAQDFEHVAIDRFTGGVSGSLKFNTRAFVDAGLEGTLRLELGRQHEPWMAGLLALVLRDLTEGDLPLGFGAAKGYGACHAEVLAVKGEGLVWSSGQPVEQGVRGKLAEKVEAFHTWVAREAKPVVAASQVPLEDAEPPAAPQPRAEALPADAFHNPYHFVPLGPEMDDPETISAKDFADSKLGALAHDRYQTGAEFFSGRVVFRVMTETPTVVGAQHERASESEPAVVKPFELDGEPALPGASLRGMISSLAEAATGSAMRVLQDRSLSYRAAMKESLPALGRLVDEGGTLKLEPLALPALPCDVEGSVFDPVSPTWQYLFPVPRLRVYVNGYRGLGREGGVRLETGTFLERVLPRSASSDHPDDRWYYPLGAPPVWDADGRPTMPRPHVKKTRNWRGEESYQVVAQDRDPGQAPPENAKPEPISQQVYDSLAAAEKALYVPGILRVLDIDGHEKEIPSQRTHEIFLPLPDPAKPAPRLDVQSALAEFHRLADERTEADEHLPFRLKGLPRTGKVRLEAGDVVFFQVDKSDPPRVTEIALSSIWRKSAGTVFDYVPSELRPLHPGRKEVSIAERVFGFVEQGLKQAGKKEPALALASRVRFSFGRMETGTTEPYLVAEPVPLQILGSPKPPAPALYFRKDGSTAVIAKSRLRPDRHAPQGRKMYLHQREAEARWQFTGDLDGDKRKHLRSKARPVRPGVAFLAHVDFDNLTERELALLLYGLRPTEPFRHLLGMGKPLGLGRVEVSPLGLFLVDRRKRYGEETDLLAGLRYHRVSVLAELEAGLGKGYPREAVAALASRAEATQGSATSRGPDLADLVGRFRAAMKEELRWALELLGDPDSVQQGVSVIYPRTDGQEQQDEKGYEWFVRNQDERHFKGHQLAPITPSRGLPTLRRQHQPVEQGGGGGRPGGQRPNAAGARSPGGARPGGRLGGQGGSRPPYRGETRRESRADTAAGDAGSPPQKPEPGKFGGVLADQLRKLKEKS